MEFMGIALRNQIVAIDGTAVNFLYGMKVNASVKGMVHGELRQEVDGTWTLNKISLDEVEILSAETDKSKLVESEVRLS